MKRAAFSLVLSLAVGVLLAWAGVTLRGLLAVFFIQHDFFGWPVQYVLVAESVLAWVPLGLLTGLLLGRVMPSNALQMSLVAFAVAFLVLSSGSWRLFFEGEVSLEALFKLLFFYASSAGVYLLAVPVGTLVYQRLQNRRKAISG